MGVGIIIKTETKWKAGEVVQQADIRLYHKALLGSVAKGRAWHGKVASSRLTQHCQHEGDWCKLVQEEVHYGGEEQVTSVDKVGADDEVKCHLAGHLEVESPED